MSNVRFSVIMPVYNAENFLSETIRNFFFNSSSDFELICINDSSTDNSLEILESYYNQFSNFKVINLDKNTGVSNARNLGLDYASGEYILFLDSDDFFEVSFFKNEIKYRYGFELDSTTIYSEWLFEDEKGKEAKLFYRDIDEEDYVNNQKFKEGYSFFDKSNKKINIAQNQLFLWVCDRLANSTISKSILKWFSNFNMLDGTDSNGYMNFTLRKMEDEEFKKEIVSLVKTADIGIENIDLQEDDIHVEDVSKVPLPDFIKEEMLKNGGVKSISINTSHKVFDDKNNFITHETFELEKDESFGTKKFFKISAPVIDTLKNGKILLIDELDSSLHPILTKHLIKLFNDEKINKNNAQLIFTTHDTNLLKPTIFKREQIWFTQKDKYGSTNLYSMLEIKGVRASDDFEKHYIQGKYGAVPYIGEFEF